MKKLPLSGKYGKGKFTMVDDEDAARLEEMGVSLSLAKNYVQFWHNGQHFLLHRFLTNTPKGLQVDHIDQDGLNNCKSNLRICTHAQNLGNQKARKGSSSKFKGVSWAKNMGKWYAKISKNKKQICIGYFETEEEAALAYNEKAKELFGEFAFLNDVGLAE